MPFGTVLDVVWPQANDANPRSPKLKMASNANVEHPLRSITRRFNPVGVALV
jgi:hypothetical protein